MSFPIFLNQCTQCFSLYQSGIREIHFEQVASVIYN